MWVSTAGSAIAERLDNIAYPPSTLVRRDNTHRGNTDHDTGEPAPTSRIEDLLAGILIRHHLNTTHLSTSTTAPKQPGNRSIRMTHRRSDGTRSKRPRKPTAVGSPLIVGVRASGHRSMSPRTTGPLWSGQNRRH